VRRNIASCESPPKEAEHPTDGPSVVFGFSERDGSALYLSQSFFSRDGELLLHRRKIKPTSVERYLWGDGGSDSIQNVVVDNETGVRIGGLNCW
jgi:predicted amidohydrolase